MKYFLGIDQGGTKTDAIICDCAGRVQGTGYDHGLATSYFKDDEGVYIDRIKSASKKACSMAGIALSDVSAVCGGLNGADWDHEIPILTDVLRLALGIYDATVLNDCIIAMRGGNVDISPDCAVICAGSGLNAAVRRSDGKEILYGYYIDDSHQGAYALGTQALKKVMDSHIGVCGETALTELVLGFTGFDDPEHLMIEYTTMNYQLENKDLAPLLTKAYAQGDKESVNIVNEFADGVSRYITVGIERLGLSGRPLDIVFSGSVFKQDGTSVAHRIFEIIQEYEPNARMIDARYEPVCGAALTLLDREYNTALPAEVTAAFEKSAQEHGLLRKLS